MFKKEKTWHFSFYWLGCRDPETSDYNKPHISWVVYNLGSNEPHDVFSSSRVYLVPLRVGRWKLTTCFLLLSAYYTQIRIFQAVAWSNKVLLEYLIFHTSHTCRSRRPTSQNTKFFCWGFVVISGGGRCRWQCIRGFCKSHLGNIWKSL